MNLASLVSIALASGIPTHMLPSLPAPRTPKLFTHADKERIEKAQEKRERKEAKRRGPK